MWIFKKKKELKIKQTKYKTIKFDVVWKYKGEIWVTNVKKKLSTAILSSDFNRSFRMKACRRYIKLFVKNPKSLLGANAYMVNFNKKNIDWINIAEVAMELTE